MDEDHPTTGTDERRGAVREPLGGPVTVAFEEQDVIGPGQNITEEGVFFIASAVLRARVQIGAAEEWRTGEVIRVQSMGDGKLGIAVRFR